MKMCIANELPKGDFIEPLSAKPRPSFLAPVGVTNVAMGKRVTGSNNPYSGKLLQVTDGKKEPHDDQAVEMRKGTQWVQIDLEAEFETYAILIWHDNRNFQAYHDVIVQAADDADFTENVRTFFNNDRDNSSRRGIGDDLEYIETCEGRLILTKGAKIRYLRCYTNGSNSGQLNCMQEVEVYALPIK
jgi:hypothetical protein